jgi:hypothetical protein
MVLMPSDPAFRFNFESWTDFGLQGYYHRIFGPLSIEPSSENKKMNCILYPGETGVITVDSIQARCEQQDSCYSNDSIKKEPPPFLGSRLLGYESFYKRFEDLGEDYERRLKAIEKMYHPEIRNFVYNIEGSYIRFEFDVTIPMELDLKGEGFSFPTWMILYDDANRIIDILYYEYDWGTIHLGENHEKGYSGVKQIYGNTAEEWWDPRANWTQEDMQRIDHIKLFLEIENVDVCVDGDI